eukprot:3578997-Rhodomonas_salina.2
MMLAGTKAAMSRGQAGHSESMQRATWVVTTCTSWPGLRWPRSAAARLAMRDSERGIWSSMRLQASCKFNLRAHTGTRCLPCCRGGSVPLALWQPLEAEAPRLEDVPGRELGNGAVLEDVAEDLQTVSGVEGELRALGVGVGPELFRLAGTHVAALMSFDCGGPLGLSG